jgi:hypothetical protein
MTGKEAVALSGRSESWLRRHSCVLCEQTLWRALRYGCGAIYERCDLAKKDFTAAGKYHVAAE